MYDAAVDTPAAAVPADDQAGDRSVPVSLARRALLGAAPLALAACANGPRGKPARAELAPPVSTDKHDELVFMSATKLAGLIRGGELSATEAVAAYYARIDAVNPQLNAVVQFCRERALAEAGTLDARSRRGDWAGPLHGVPMTIKDSFDTEGVISTGGTQGRAFFIPPKDATVVARLRARGAILLGKTNTPEFTLGGVSGLGTTVNIVYGMSRNPYDHTRSTSGSTGGGGAIVAAGGSAFDFGSDFGGSIRGPAHANGIAGMKPTTGRVPRTGHIVDYGGVFDSYQQVGPLARRVEDLMTILPLVTGPDFIDAAIQPMPWSDPRRVDLSRLRVAYYFDLAEDAAKPTPEMQATVQKCVDYFARLGCAVRPSRPPDAMKIADLSTRLREGDGNAWQKRLVEKYHTTVPGPNRRFDYPLIETATFTELLEERDAWRSRMMAWVKDFDLIVCPPALGPAPKIGDRSAEGVRGGGFTTTYNIAGYPSGVVRAGTSPEHMPLGVMLTAQPWREDIVLAAMLAIESEFGGWQPPPH
ncbi:amidase [Solimonas soli]|uniref:amidase n=1 Tax=Solimonas soli TaxID=413479 RepID=UPI0009FBCF27|nr:amidase [Solimonas soli]